MDTYALHCAVSATLLRMVSNNIGHGSTLSAQHVLILLYMPLFIDGYIYMYSL